jgi:hypothetical protein
MKAQSVFNIKFTDISWLKGGKAAAAPTGAGVSLRKQIILDPAQYDERDDFAPLDKSWFSFASDSNGVYILASEARGPIFLEATAWINQVKLPSVKFTVVVTQ